MARSTFSGPVRSLRGFLGSGPDMATGTIAAGTVDGGTDITGIDLYQGKVVQLGNNTVVFNLPEIITTATSAVAGANDPNSGNRVGLMYTFLLTANLSGETFTLNAGTAAGRSTADVYEGILWYANTGADPHSTSAWTAGSSDTLTLDATTRGGLCGSTIYVRAVGANMWTVNAYVTGVGTQATPWS